jgi:hypothetical protein
VFVVGCFLGGGVVGRRRWSGEDGGGGLVRAGGDAEAAQREGEGSAPRVPGRAKALTG